MAGKGHKGSKGCVGFAPPPPPPRLRTPHPSYTGVLGPFGHGPQVFTDAGVASSDYIFERQAFRGTTLHVRSAPSPGCTASLAIAEHVVDIAQTDFNLAGTPETTTPAAEKK
jgi:hypothetical protein